jgi:hypothetical protein
MTDDLLLHGNAWPHTSLRTSEAIAKMGWTVLPHPAHSPDLAPSNYRLFDLVNSHKHYVDAILQTTTNLKKSFVMCSEVEERNFAALLYSALFNAGKSMLKMIENLWKNSLITGKDV